MGGMRTTRRALLRDGFLSLGLVVAGGSLLRCRPEAAIERVPRLPQPPLGVAADKAATLESHIPHVGPLQAPDALGLRLPRGFKGRVVARSSELVAGTGFRWHTAPDGGATFPLPDGGFVYVSNSEAPANGGASALRFDASGDLVAAYPILEGTAVNCAGGPTPWGTWLSCEEHERGRVWECDPLGHEPAIVRPALGVFEHEAVTVDPVRGQLYLTEDVRDGRLYRFTPDARSGARLDLAAGSLHALRVTSGREGAVTWVPVSDPRAERAATRRQAADATRFDGGEGIWWHEHHVYFTTKGDNRVWALDVAAQTLSIVYDAKTATDPSLTGVDNLIVSASGELIIAEDGGDMQLVALTKSGALVPLVQVVGHDGSEITGPAFDPSGTRLYFSSQRGASGERLGRDGVTYEISGPFVG